MREAYEDAKSALFIDPKAQECNKGCCCNHKHREDCWWLKYREKYGAEKAHEMHSRPCTCNPTGVTHEAHCQRLLHFNEVRKAELANAEKPPAKKNDFGFDFDYDDDDLILDSEEDCPEAWNEGPNFVVCCCDPDAPHDESSKIIILGDESKLGEPLFNDGDLPFGELVELNNFKKINKLKVGRDHKNQLIGRNLEIQKLVKLLTNINDEYSRLI